MRRLAFLVLFICVFAWAEPQPAEYSVTVHVISSHWVMQPTVGNDSQAVQRLDVLIDGKKYELEAPALRANLQAGVTLLAPGDYKAKLVQDAHKTKYESSQAYEFLFPDTKTRKFIVVGLSE